MTIYVDQPKWKWRRRWWCHLFTDGKINELHNFAKEIGLEREWFQDKEKFPHYDITENKRKLALKKGAKELKSKEILLRIKNHFGRR